MKTSTLVLTIVGSSLLSAVATSALWVLADGLRPPLPAISVRLANPAQPQPAAPLAVAVVAPTPPPAAAAPLVAPGAVLPDEVDPPLATATASPALVPPASDLAASPAPAPAMQDTAVVAPSAAPDAPAPSSPVATAEMAASLADTGNAPAPVASQAAAPAPVTTDEQGDAAGDDATTAVASGAEPVTEIVYRDTYISYLGYDAIQINTIPWYCRRFHLAEDEVLCVCFIARAAQVPFGTAIVTYVQECGSSCQALLGYYHLSPLIFFITPADDLRFPGSYQRPYRWLREGGQAPVRFSNQEYQDLLALKLSTDYLRAAPQDFFTVAQGAAPLHLMRGTARRPASPVVHAAAGAPATGAPFEEQRLLRTEPVRTEPLRSQPTAANQGWERAPQGSGLIPVVPPSQAQQQRPHTGFVMAPSAVSAVPSVATPTHASAPVGMGAAGGAPGTVIPGH